MRGGWVGSDVWDKVPKERFFWAPSLITILIIIITSIVTIELYIHLRTILHEDDNHYHHHHQHNIIKLYVHLRTILHNDDNHYHHHHDIIEIFVHLRTILNKDDNHYHHHHRHHHHQLFVHLWTILHEDEHLLSVDLDSKVVDQVGMVDRLEDTQLIGDVPDDKSV